MLDARLMLSKHSNSLPCLLPPNCDARAPANSIVCQTSQAASPPGPRLNPGCELRRPAETGYGGRQQRPGANCPEQRRPTVTLRWPVGGRLNRYRKVGLLYPTGSTLATVREYVVDAISSEHTWAAAYPLFFYCKITQCPQKRTRINAVIYRVVYKQLTMWRFRQHFLRVCNFYMWTKCWCGWAKYGPMVNTNIHLSPTPML